MTAKVAAVWGVERGGDVGPNRQRPGQLLIESFTIIQAHQSCKFNKENVLNVDGNSSMTRIAPLTKKPKFGLLCVVTSIIVQFEDPLASNHSGPVHLIARRAPSPGKVTVN